MNLEELIRSAATAAARKTVQELKRSGMIVDTGTGMTRYKRAEAILRRYGEKKIGAEQARRVEQALAGISEEPYAEVIQLFYFESKTNAEIAEMLHASDRTIQRKRQRLVQKLSSKL